MTGVAKVLGYVAFGLMALFGLLGGLFVAGYAFEDPGGWVAVAMTAAWVVPLAALAGFGLLRPEQAGPLFVGVTAVVCAFTLADAVFGVIPRDAWGPVAAVTVFALGVALAFLGLHRAGLAGLLMLVTAFTQLAATVVAVAVRSHGPGPGPGALLGGSSGVVVLPLVVVGVMFLVAAALAREPLTPEQKPPVPTAR